MEIKDVCIVIPSLNPDYDILTKYVEQLRNIGFQNIVIVNDGSKSTCQKTFEKCTELGAKVISHDKNRGKGAALKTGYQYVLDNVDTDCIGIITADSDGQHRAEDLLNVYKAMRENPGTLILGCRDFEHSENIPPKSLNGNRLTVKVFKFLYGTYISDTQTGLRGIPKGLLKEHIGINGDGFQYEMNVLVQTVHRHYQIIEVPIQTIYINRNSETHFRPVVDSLRIYAVLLAQFLQYSLSSVISTLIELIVFQLIVSALKANLPVTYILVATVCGRVAALIFNYAFNRKFVFKEVSRNSIAKYLFLVLGQFTASVGLVTLLCVSIGLSELPVKIIVDTALFLITYRIQSRRIFNEKADEKVTIQHEATDWTAYYRQEKSKWSTFTQRFTLHYLEDLMDEIGVDSGWKYCECGGGNSCFALDLIDKYKLQSYDIIDNCQLGLEKAKIKVAKSQTYNIDLTGDMAEDLASRYDLVYSIGLIEHFSDTDRARVLQNHFRITKSGGYVLITAPTPTRKYMVVRKFMELIHKWQFWDEYPIELAKMVSEMGAYGEVIHAGINQKLPLTQAVVLVKKR